MEMYAQYIKERENKECLYSDKGFATYLFDGKTCYIENVFIKPEFRRTKECFKLADKIVEIAKEKGCTSLMGTVCPSAPGSTISLKMLLAYGMQLISATTNFIILSKDIGEK